MPAVTMDEVKEKRAIVLALDKECKQNGFRPGWVYHRCVELDLLPVLRELERQGEISRYDPETLATYGHSTISADAREVMDQLIPGTKINFPKLELIPETCRQQNVRSVVSSQVWRVAQTTTFSRANYRCQMCGDKPGRGQLHCHESWDFNTDTRTQSLKHLFALCRECHDLVHIDLAADMGRGVRAVERFMKLAKLPRIAVEQYLCDAYEQQQARSKHDWVLDVSRIKCLRLLPSAEASAIGVNLNELKRRKSGRRGEIVADRPSEPQRYAQIPILYVLIFGAITGFLLKFVVLPLIDKL